MDSILLNINTNDLNIRNTHDFTIQFDSLQLDHNADYHIALVSYNIPYTWYNISVSQGNNQFRYSPDAINYYTVTIPDGNYGIDDLNIELQDLIVANGHTADVITFSGDYNSMRADLQITNIAWRVDFRDINSPNNFRNILGFNNQEYSGADGNLFRAENRANITNDIDSV